jgi:hypothetical protein
VEAHVAELSASASSRPAAERPPTEAPAAPDKRDPKAEYEREIAAQRQALQEHDREVLDENWARAQSGAMRDQLSSITPLNQHFQVANVDCRSKTCIVQLVSATPDDALEYRGDIHHALPMGCHGMSSSLEPPTAPGPYKTTLIYTCR